MSFTEKQKLLLCELLEAQEPGEHRRHTFFFDEALPDGLVEIDLCGCDKGTSYSLTEEGLRVARGAFEELAVPCVDCMMLDLPLNMSETVDGGICWSCRDKRVAQEPIHSVEEQRLDLAWEKGADDER